MSSETNAKAEESLRNLGARLRAAVHRRPLTETQRKAVHDVVREQWTRDMEQQKIQPDPSSSEKSPDKKIDLGPELGP